MAAEIQQATGQASTLIEGRGGVFVIRQDGRVRYDKAETGRFPAPGEAARLLGGAG